MRERPRRIVIIDDSPEDRAVYRRHLARGREADYQFWEAGLGEDGLRLCGEVGPDCVLLDYQLPDRDGLEVLGRLRAQASGPDVTVVMLAGQGNEAVAVEAMKKGAQDYLVKGLDGDNLRQALHSAIDKGDMRRQIAGQRQELERLAAERLGLIAELRAHTDALSEANRRKDEFLAMLGHELRNPLAPIRNGLQIIRLARNASEVEQVHAMLDRQVCHIVRLVDDLLDVSRISKGKIRLSKARTDLTAVVNRAIDTARPLVDLNRHELSAALPAEPLWVDGDPDRLEQVLTNLLNNAVKYMPPGGKIWVEVQGAGGEAVVRVRDNGMGIAEEMIPRVFELFAQAEQSLARTQGGLGVGLTLVRLLVEMHGGSVTVRSDGPDRGTEFEVRLPLDPAAVGPLAPDAGEPAGPVRPLRVLVVDDNRDAATSLAMLLELTGHAVHTAHDGPAALAAVTAWHPQAVLLDIGMPDMDGYRVAEQLRAGGATDLLLIAVTGYGQDGDRTRARAAGFDHHLTKPVELGDLQRLLASVGGACTA